MFPPAPAPLVRINEVLASNTETINFGTQFPDIIELYNAGNATANLTGWGPSDNAADPYKFTITNVTVPGSASLAPGAYLVIYASNNAAVTGPKTGFSLKQSGDDLTLTKPVAQGGGAADSVTWGQQINDLSIGRAADGSWALCRPTFGSANVLAGQSPIGAVVINEWLADAVTLFANDFIELFNPGTLPVDIGVVSSPTMSPAGPPAPDRAAHVHFEWRLPHLQGRRRHRPGAGPRELQALTTAGRDRFFCRRSESLIDLVVYGPQHTM
jgi:hypothetical protein